MAKALHEYILLDTLLLLNFTGNEYGSNNNGHKMCEGTVHDTVYPVLFIGRTCSEFKTMHT